jgi:hypothetical protein
MRAIAGAIVVLAGAMLMVVVATCYVAHTKTVIQGPTQESQQHITGHAVEVRCLSVCLPQTNEPSLNIGTLKARRTMRAFSTEIPHQ